MSAKHTKKNNKKRRVLLLLFLIIIIISAVYACNIIVTKNNKEKYKDLLDNIQVTPTAEKTERMLQLEELQKANGEIKAWLEISGTSVNYPVLQGTDNAYYMTHDYKKENSKNGAIFLDKDYNWTLPSANLLIYGHNNKNGTMFEELLKYNEKNYYEEHPIIRFTTNNEDAEYEIISVFQSRVYYKSEKNVFRYYYFVDAANEEEYNEYVKNSKEASLYDTGKTAQYGDQLLTLSTCSYHTEDGRFAVVARKIK